MTPAEIKKIVKNHYGKFAQTGLALESGLNGSGQYPFSLRFYEQPDLSSVPQNALRLTCGCGNPIGFANIQPSSSVVDLGCGGGVDVILAAHKVKEQGRVLGIDLAPEMVERTKQALAEAGLQHRHIFLRVADIEEISSLPKTFADFLISNCVINLCPDKVAVYRNIFRILRPGGILAVSDIVWTEEIDTNLRKRFQSSGAGCLGGAVSEENLRLILKKSTFIDIQVLGHYYLSMEELETIACYPGKAFVLPPSQEDLLLLKGRVAGITIIARRPPINC